MNRVEINSPVTVKEIDSAIAKIPRKRTPDVDRLPADFYRMFCQAQICIVGLLL